MGSRRKKKEGQAKRNLEKVQQKETRDGMVQLIESTNEGHGQSRLEEIVFRLMLHKERRR